MSKNVLFNKPVQLCKLSHCHTFLTRKKSILQGCSHEAIDKVKHSWGHLLNMLTTSRYYIALDLDYQLLPTGMQLIICTQQASTNGITSVKVECRNYWSVGLISVIGV